jgi:phenylpyruvate tautomerase PptA (4-oxalocrotonate tautomerase family)
MPLVNIDLLVGRADRDLRLIGDAVHEAMVEQLNVPPRDRFQVVTQHSAATLQFDRHYLAVVLVENERTDWSFGRGQASYVVLPREQWR